MNDGLLPIGSVVKAIDPDAPLLMIVGLFPETETRSADYLAVPYPVGMELESASLLLDVSEVDSVVFRGYQDDYGAAALAEAQSIAALLGK